MTLKTNIEMSRLIKKTTNEEIEVKDVREEKWVEYFVQLYISTNTEEEHQETDNMKQ